MTPNDTTINQNSNDMHVLLFLYADKHSSTYSEQNLCWILKAPTCHMWNNLKKITPGLSYLHLGIRQMLHTKKDIFQWIGVFVMWLGKYA